MAIRITGMNSGLDTESIISELVSAKSAKKTSLVKAQTKLSWKQEAWKTLNSKIYSFYTSKLSDMRFSDVYKQKKTTVSDASVASVVTGAGTSDGVQTLKVDDLARSGYLTGGVISKTDGTDVSSDTTMSELMGLGADESATISIKVGNKETRDISLNGSSKVSDVIAQLKSAGVNASFDSTNQRIFVSATSTGSAAEFSLKGSDTNGIKALASMGILTDNKGDAAYAAEVAAAGVKFSDDASLGTKAAARNAAQDAKIVLNGATFTSSSNTFEVNGLTITALAESDKEVTLTTATDYDGVYDSIKNFLSSYNTLINEISKLYGAESADDYEPLTSEEKEAMSESEIEDWEEKIKSALLRKDSTLGTLKDTMVNAMQKGFKVSGETYYLSSFGINTASYFDADKNERNALHIDGDEDDSYCSDKENKLKAMIASNPEAVMGFFQELTNNLYSELQNKMSKTSLSSAMTFYNDIEMKEEYDEYTEDIKDQEERIADFEDRWYSKFSAMEVALAQMQSKTNAVSSMLG